MHLYNVHNQSSISFCLMFKIRNFSNNFCFMHFFPRLFSCLVNSNSLFYLEIYFSDDFTKLRFYQEWFQNELLTMFFLQNYSIGKFKKCQVIYRVDVKVSRETKNENAQVPALNKNTLFLKCKPQVFFFDNAKFYNQLSTTGQRGGKTHIGINPLYRAFNGLKINT